MIKTEFVFENVLVVAYAKSVSGDDLSNMVIKFVDQEGERVYPRFDSRKRDEIEELAMEYLQNEETEAELYF